VYAKKLGRVANVGPVMKLLVAIRFNSVLLAIETPSRM
jgi:hypothetical protein